MRVLVFSCVLLALTTACNGCDDELDAVPGTLIGRACSEEDRQGLAEKTVEVRGPKRARSATNGTGSFRIENLPIGSYDVFVGEVDDAGAFVAFHQVNVAPVIVASSDETEVTDPRCGERPGTPGTGDVDGEICNRHTGELLVAAEVTITAPDGTVLGTAVTDSDGRFHVDDVREGDNTVRIKTTGFDRSFPVTVVKNETALLDLNQGTCAVPFATGCTILGSLCDPDGDDGARLAGATVSVTNADGSVNEVDTTDSAGQFFISALLPGRYDVVISKPAANVSETFADVACEAGGETVIEGPTTCAGTPPLGRLQGALCTLVDGVFTGSVRLLQGGVERYRTTTDSNGFFSFDAVVPGTYELHLGEPTERIYTDVVVQTFQTTLVEEDRCPEPDDTCRSYPHTPEVTSDGRIVFVVDRSRSMLQPGDSEGRSKWDVLRDTLQEVTASLSRDIEYSLVVYPDPGNDIAEPNHNCATGVERLATGTANDLNAALDVVVPNGGTPTAATLRAALPTVRALADDGRPLAVVLATDGAPNCVDPSAETIACTCTASSIEPPQNNDVCPAFNCLDETIGTHAGPLAEIATLGVKTHVVGITDGGSAANDGIARVFTDALNAMAVAGGAPREGPVRYHDGGSTAALRSSLQAITRRILACQITVRDGEAPVVLDGASSLEVRLGDAPLPHDVTKQNGWAQTGPSSIELFGSACEAATVSSLSVVVRRCVPPT